MRRLVIGAWLAAVVVACAALVAGCGGGGKKGQQGGPATIVGWAFRQDPAFEKSLGKIVRDFQQTHPGIKVQLKYFPNANGAPSQKMAPVVAAHNGPDFFLETGSTFSPSQQVVADVPLDGYLKQISNQVIIPEKLRSPITHHIYEVPWSLQAYSFFYYNKPLLKKYGLDPNQVFGTFGDVLHACTTLRAHGMQMPMAIGMKDGEPAAMTAWLGGQFLTVPEISKFWYGQLPITDPRIEKGFTNLKAMADAGCFGANPGTVTFADAQPNFAGGKSAFTVTQFALRTEIQSQAKAIGGLQNLGVAALPPEPGTIYGNQPTIDGTSGDTWSTLCYSQHRQQVWTFLKYLTTAKAERIMWEGFGQFPNNRALLNQLAHDTSLEPQVRQVFQMLNNPKLHIGPWLTGAAADTFNRLAPQWIDGKISTTALSAQLQKAFQQVIADGKQSAKIHGACH